MRHDGVDYGDYIEQLTYLLFLKMADEKKVTIPAVFFKHTECFFKSEVGERVAIVEP